MTFVFPTPAEQPDGSEQAVRREVQRRRWREQKAAHRAVLRRRSGRTDYRPRASLPLYCEQPDKDNPALQCGASTKARGQITGIPSCQTHYQRERRQKMQQESH